MIEIGRINWILALFFFGIISVCAILGIFCNAFLIVTTIKTKTMRATCNILIAICAISDIFHEMGALLQFPFLLDTKLEIDNRLCYCIMFLPDMGIAIGCACILCVGVDRMFSVLFSIQYKVINRLYYHSALFFVIFGYCAIILIIMVTSYQERLVSCEIITPFRGIGVFQLALAVLTINTISAIVYLITWIGLRAKADVNLMKRIVKSLFIIVAVDISGWILTSGFFALFHFLNFNDEQLFTSTFFNRIFINLALSVKLFIYYSTSSEYRTAINAVLSRNKSISQSKRITVIM